ncbi:E4 protein, partial [Phocoena phocoena papillomavirus 2]
MNVKNMAARANGSLWMGQMTLLLYLYLAPPAHLRLPVSSPYYQRLLEGRKTQLTEGHLTLTNIPLHGKGIGLPPVKSPPLNLQCPLPSHLYLRPQHHQHQHQQQHHQQHQQHPQAQTAQASPLDPEGLPQEDQETQEDLSVTSPTQDDPVTVTVTVGLPRGSELVFTFQLS